MQNVNVTRNIYTKRIAAAYLCNSGSISAISFRFPYNFLKFLAIINNLHKIFTLHKFQDSKFQISDTFFFLLEISNLSNEYTQKTQLRMYAFLFCNFFFFFFIIIIFFYLFKYIYIFFCIFFA